MENHTGPALPAALRIFPNGMEILATESMIRRADHTRWTNSWAAIEELARLHRNTNRGVLVLASVWPITPACDFVARF